MNTRYKKFALLATVVALLTFPNSSFASLGIGIVAGDSFQTATIALESFKLGNDQPAGEYSFRMIGKGTPGVVDVRILDSTGKEVGKLTGKFAGTCPGKPHITTFAKLGYSKSSPIKAARQNAGTLITVECKQGSRIEVMLPGVD